MELKDITIRRVAAGDGDSDDGLSDCFRDCAMAKGRPLPEIFSLMRNSEVSNCKEDAAGDASVYVTVNMPERRVLHRVSQLRREKKKDIFDPSVLTLGPYHHRKNPEYQLGEQVKKELCDVVCGATDKGSLLTEIGARIDEIRHFYSDGRYSYSDDELCEMMLRDACFVLCYIDIKGPNGKAFDSIRCRLLGMSGTLLVYQDTYKLENQIPLWLIQMLYSLLYGGGQLEFQEFLGDFLRNTLVKDGAKMRIPWEEGEEEEPLHLLEAIYRISLGDPVPSKKGSAGRQPITGLESTSSPFGSVRYLKAKGIHLGPSSDFLREIKFFSFSFYGKLQLPMLSVHDFTNGLFSNMIALEMSPGSPTDFTLTSYVVFMKALIEKAEDAKELRDKGILSNMLGSDQEVVTIFQSLDTYGYCNNELFRDVHERIQKHCNNKAKTWMAEFFSTYFSSPWTAIALFAAIFLLTLTCIQTYYTVNPAT